MDKFLVTLRGKEMEREKTKNKNLGACLTASLAAKLVPPDAWPERDG